jgi:hypothetical protein
MLSRHPDVFMAPNKDPLFFELDAEYRQGPAAYWERYFQDWKGEKAIGEARPTKLMLPYVPERVRRCLPDARLIAILRDPAERLFSHWWMRRCNGLEAQDLEEALRRNEAAIDAGRTFEGETGIDLWREHLEAPADMAPVYLEYGYYASQLARWLEHFEEERIKVVFFEDLTRDPDAVLRDLLAFLGVDPSLLMPGRAVYNAALPGPALSALDLDRRIGLSRVVPRRLKQALKDLLSRRGSPPHLDPAVRHWLVEHYNRHIRSLEALIGRDLSTWKTG